MRGFRLTGGINCRLYKGRVNKAECLMRVVLVVEMPGIRQVGVYQGPVKHNLDTMFIMSRLRVRKQDIMTMIS